MATNAELAAMLGLSRAESVPNSTRRLGVWLALFRGTAVRSAVVERRIEVDERERVPSDAGRLEAARAEELDHSNSARR